jgi:hypothetical protein
VHKDLICSISPYFKAAFTSGFQECESGAMKLETVEVETFDLFYNWLYGRSLLDDGCDEFEPRPTEQILLQLYVFAGMAQIPLLKNVTLRAFYETVKLEANPSTGNIILAPATLAYVWENTTESSPLRRMVLDLCAWKLDGNIMFADFWATGMTVPICLEIMRAMSKKSPYMADPFLSLLKYDEAVPNEEEKKK